MANNDYTEEFPEMPVSGWEADPSYDLGWINGLFNVAEKSIGNLFGDYKYEINEDDLTDIEDLNNFGDDAKGAIVYMSIWAGAALIFTIAGIVWCICNKCICCCRSSFKGRGKDYDEFQSDPRYDLSPRYSERNKKIGNPSPAAIVVAVLMAIWLVGLLLMILHTFGANQKTKESINQIDDDLTHSLRDIIHYLTITTEQVAYTFGEAYDMKLRRSLDGIMKTCSDPGGQCTELVRQVNARFDQGNGSLSTELRDFIDALQDVDEEARAARQDLENNFEDILNNVANGLYWLFMLFNLIYVTIFCLILVGTILAAFAKQSGIKTAGYLLMRVAVVLIFIMGILVVAQLIIMFAAGGLISEAVCPAIRRLETEEPRSSLLNSSDTVEVASFQDSGYKLPTVGSILRDCKAGKSAFQVFNLQQTVGIDPLLDVIDKSFEEIRNIPPTAISGAVYDEVRRYTSFVRDSVHNKIGVCSPAYNAMNTTISLFCHKIAAPIISFWWILQYVAVVFLLIVITVIVFERIHF